MNDAYLFGRKIPFPLSIYLGVDLLAWVVILILIYLSFIYKCIFWGIFTVFSIMLVLVSLLVYELHFSISLTEFAILVPTLTLVFFLLLLDDSHLNWGGIIFHCLFCFSNGWWNEVCFIYLLALFVFLKLFVCFFFFLWCSGSNPRPWTFSGKHAVGSLVHALFCASPLVLEAVSPSDSGVSGTHCRVQMALNLGSSCLCRPSDGITGMRHHIWLPLCSLAHSKLDSLLLGV